MAQSHRGESLRVSRAEIAQMTAAAVAIRACRSEFAVRNTDPVSEVTAGSPTVCDWRHYPEGEVYDSTSHAQFFYHAHPLTSRPTSERGHFHTFLRADGMPSGIAPLLLPELAIANTAALSPHGAPRKRGARDEVSHLIAIAVDARGEPIRLFTTNRWVTGETWYRAADVIEMLDRFVVTEPEPSAVLNCWIGAVIGLFRPQIAALLRARDETVMAWRRRRRTQVFEDLRLEVTSSLEIDLDAQLSYVDEVSGVLGENSLDRVASLPGMAEGWQEGRAG